MHNNRFLILAGTREARDLADQMSDAGFTVISSFAGVTKEPILPRGEVRTGGFGGVVGLVDYLIAAKISHVIDATHPFAAQMSRNAQQAATTLALPLLRLERSEWVSQNGDHWTIVFDMLEAASHIPQEAHVLVTTGRKNLETLFARPDVTGVIRTIEAPDEMMPAGWQLLLDRPPYKLEQERQHLLSQRISHIICKNAGGSATSAKLEAARELRLPVIMLARPAKPACATVATVSEALNWAATIGLESDDSQDSLPDITKG